MLSQDEKQWAKLLQEALAEYMSRKQGTASTPAIAAAPAAPLKPLLVRRAELAGLKYPPAGLEHLKFAEFLALFPSVVRLKRRLGQDMLVATAEKAAVLQAEATDEAVYPADKTVCQRLRQDIFKAFTRLLTTGRVYVYTVANDRFTEVDEAGVGDAEAIRVPTQTLDAALSERRDFASGVADANACAALLAALATGSSPLGAFGQAVKQHGLGHLWHDFRMERMRQRIQEWASSAGLVWNPAWLGGMPAGVRQADIFTAREANAFLAGMMQLGPKETQRVMVPLDIVLKLLRRV